MERKEMKVLKNLLTVAAASALLGTAAFTAPATKGTLKLYEPVTVQGTELAPGEYLLEWNGQGPNVQVSIAKGKKEIVSVPAQVVPVNQKTQASGYTAKKEQDGKSTLTEIFLQGRPYEIRVGEQAASAVPPAASTGSNQ
jgi:hypothetical protein